MRDLELLIRDKYEGDAARVTEEDRARLAAGEPLAHVIGWVPFCGLRLYLDSRPLIPRPETEWWTEELIKRIGDAPLTVLDLCAGSGAIGLAVLKHCPNARVVFAELKSRHVEQIRENLFVNGLDGERASVFRSDLFDSLITPSLPFDIIATNPPYVPESRALERSVLDFEPPEALFAGVDGLDLIRRIATDAPQYLNAAGELWMEADISNVEEAARLIVAGGGKRTDIRSDPYERERLVIAYY